MTVRFAVQSLLTRSLAAHMVIVAIAYITGLSTEVWPFVETSRVHFVPFQYRNSKRPVGSGNHCASALFDAGVGVGEIGALVTT